MQAAGSHASIGGSEYLTGRLDGMNAHGLTIGLHRVKKSPRFPGLSATLIVRLILDRCASTAEAVAMLQEIPHAMQYNYSMLDAAGTPAVIEAGPGMVAVRTGHWLACTNHFQSPLLSPLNRRPAHSEGRLPPLETWASRDPLRRSDVHRAEPFEVAGLSIGYVERRHHRTPLSASKP